MGGLGSRVLKKIGDDWRVDDKPSDTDAEPALNPVPAKVGQARAK